ncbi:hypothetical protein V8F33_012230 [Rhypophila sp. PSN 637]
MAAPHWEDIESIDLLCDEARIFRARIINHLMGDYGMEIGQVTEYLEEEFGRASEQLFEAGNTPEDVGVNQHHLKSWFPIVLRMDEQSEAEYAQLLDRCHNDPEFPDAQSPEYTDFHRRMTARQVIDDQIELTRTMAQGEIDQRNEQERMRQDELAQEQLEQERIKEQRARVCRDTTRAVERIWSQYENGHLDFTDEPHNNITGVGAMLREVWRATAERDNKVGIDWEACVLLATVV